MEKLKLNETPVRTSRNFLINNVKLENVEIPNNITEFENVTILNDSSKITIENEVSNLNLRYGLSEFLSGQVENSANSKLKITANNKTNSEVQVEYELDEENRSLVENIEIVANEDTNSTIILKYLSQNSTKYYHNGVIRVIAKNNAKINIVVINLLNTSSNNFLAIENQLEKNSKVNYTIVDLGGKNSITNYYSNIIGEKSENNLNTIYLGKEDQLFDLNYTGELRGEKSSINIDVQGALKDSSKKHFKGTIDFKKGCKKAIGNENENCMLLSDTARSIALPMLLCSEEDVEGNHSSSAGKIGEKELFYIMSRGFKLKEALKLMVRAKFNKILESIKNEKLKEEIVQEIDKRLN